MTFLCLLPTLFLFFYPILERQTESSRANVEEVEDVFVLAPLSQPMISQRAAD